MLALAALFAYLGVCTFVVEQQRALLEGTVLDIERAHAEEDRLHRVNFSLARAIVSANERYHRRDPSRDFIETLVAAEAVQAGIEDLAGRHPELATVSRQVSVQIEALRESAHRERLLDLRASLHGAAAAMDGVTSRARDHKSALNGLYRARYDQLSLIWTGLAIMGTVVFGSLLLIFLTRLGWDLKKLEARALAVVKGYRGAPLAVTRHDEMGALMRAVNRMQQELREHEAQVELGRRQQFHREKMAAVGGLAAQIAHEINNPIAAIVGLAESTCGPHAGLIVEQARRVSAINRQLAEFASPQPLEPQLIDLNGLIDNTCAFVRYDKRFGALQLALELDGRLPAVNAVADHLTQVLMNLLINAADAIAGTGAKGRIAVATCRAGDDVVLSVSDNGTGMDEFTRAHAFDEFFTTKPRGTGFGLGLALSRRLLAEAGARIELDSRPGAGTVVTVRIPLAPAAA